MLTINSFFFKKKRLSVITSFPLKSYLSKLMLGSILKKLEYWLYLWIFLSACIWVFKNTPRWSDSHLLFHSVEWSWTIPWRQSVGSITTISYGNRDKINIKLKQTMHYEKVVRQCTRPSEFSGTSKISYCKYFGYGLKLQPGLTQQTPYWSYGNRSFINS